MQKILDWFGSLTRQQRRQLIVGLLVSAALLGLWFSNRQVTVASAPAGQPQLQIDTKIRVHVVGSVVAPGLYELERGAIAHDAISLAGGFAHGAAEHSVNLARALNDGEQLIVLSEEQANQPTLSGRISLNRASERDLEELPGIGPALAKRIVDYRAEIGSFGELEELTSVSGIGTKLFAQIQDQLTL